MSGKTVLQFGCYYNTVTRPEQQWCEIMVRDVSKAGIDEHSKMTSRTVNYAYTHMLENQVLGCFKVKSFRTIWGLTVADLELRSCSTICLLRSLNFNSMPEHQQPWEGPSFCWRLKHRCMMLVNLWKLWIIMLCFRQLRHIIIPPLRKMRVCYILGRLCCTCGEANSVQYYNYHSRTHSNAAFF